MPTLYGQNTTVQLSIADLDRTVTLNPRTQHATESIKKVAQEFARGSKDGTLTETALNTEDGSHIRFLGKHEDMPFFMVHAGKYLFDQTTMEKRNRRPARVPFAGESEGKSVSTAVDLDGETVGTSNGVTVEPDPNFKPPFIPHALCLSVFLSTSSFLPTKDRVPKGKEMNDIKIDVYFNGELCGSHYVPRRYSGEAYAMTEQIVRFTGRRIGRLVEKPWIIVPSGQNPDGGLREYRRGGVACGGAQQRWNDISDALMAEADKIGQNESGERPIIGQYLESLAQLSMPKEVEDMQKAGGPKHGILDVVLIWGRGNKKGPDAPYIVKPTPITNEGFTTPNLDQSMDHTPLYNSSNLTDNPYAAPKSPSEALANARSIDDSSAPSPVSVAASLLPTLNNETSPAASSPPNKRLFPAPPFEMPTKRSRGHYYDIFTTKQTLSEEFDSIATAPSFLTTSRTSRIARAKRASTVDGSPLSSAPMTRDHTPAQTKIMKIKLPSPAQFATSPGMVMTTPYVQDGGADSQFIRPSRSRTTPPRPKQREPAPTQPSAEAQYREFVTPALSADCSTTYAPVGYVRNVGAVRGGVFREGGVIMGARFVVGG